MYVFIHSRSGGILMISSDLSTITTDALSDVSKRAINALIDKIVAFIANEYKDIEVATKHAYHLYLKNSLSSYKVIKTFANTLKPRNLVGEDGVYTPLTICVSDDYKSEAFYITIESISDIFRIGNNVGISGLGGSGKSVLLQYLFVEAVNSGNYIPVILQLRDLEKLDSEQDLIDLLHKSMVEFDVQLDLGQLQYSLKTGKYIILLDGIDEIPYSIRSGAEKYIQDFQKKYPMNRFIVTARTSMYNPQTMYSFTWGNIEPLSIQQAIALINRLAGKQNKNALSLISQLENRLFNEYHEFTSNPLLLTIMYMTYVRTQTLPTELIEFYEDAFIALLKEQDSMKNGMPKRIFSSGSINRNQLTDIFSYVSFHSYFRDIYEFRNKDQIIDLIKKGIQKTRLPQDIEPDQVLNDFLSISLIVKEDGYQFVHHSFQVYFAAKYVALHIPDDKQSHFFKEKVKGYSNIYEDFFHILFQLQYEKSVNNILYPGIKQINETINPKDIIYTKDEQSADFLMRQNAEFLMRMCPTIVVEKKRLKLKAIAKENDSYCYQHNILRLFYNTVIKNASKDNNSQNLFAPAVGFSKKTFIEKLYYMGFKTLTSETENQTNFYYYGEPDAVEIATADVFQANEYNTRSADMLALYDVFKVEAICKTLKKWISDMDIQRAKQIELDDL